MDNKDLDGYLTAMMVVLGVRDFTGDVKCSVNTWGNSVISVEFSGLNESQVVCLSKAATWIRGNRVEVAVNPYYS
jgi:hypothetical protein